MTREPEVFDHLAGYLARVGQWMLRTDARLDRRTRRNTDADARVLTVLLLGVKYGNDIGRLTGLGPGRAYPALWRLVYTGQAVREWDDDRVGYRAAAL